MYSTYKNDYQASKRKDNEAHHIRPHPIHNQKLSERNSQNQNTKNRYWPPHKKKRFMTIRKCLQYYNHQ